MTTYPRNNDNPANAMPVWISPPPSAAGITVTNITTATGTQVDTDPGTFIGLTINTPHSGAAAAVYDGTSAAGILLGTISLAAQGAFEPPSGGWPYATGLFIVTTGSPAADITVTSL